MNKIVEILMDRDDMTQKEAKELVAETREEVMAGDPWEAEEIMRNNLGLEPDYIFDLLLEP